jgi:hypothetical protein
MDNSDHWEIFPFEPTSSTGSITGFLILFKPLMLSFPMHHYLFVSCDILQGMIEFDKRAKYWET